MYVGRTSAVQLLLNDKSYCHAIMNDTILCAAQRYTSLGLMPVQLPKLPSAWLSCLVVIDDASALPAFVTMTFGQTVWCLHILDFIKKMPEISVHKMPEVVPGNSLRKVS